MFGHASVRRAAALLASGALFAAPFGPVAQVASAQCADPRGNSYCTNGGQVTFNSPPAQPQNPNPPRNVSVQNPDPPKNVPVQNPNPPRTTSVQNPNPPRNAPVQNPNPPRNVNVQNPNPPTNVNVQNPNPPLNVNVDNPNPPMNVDVQNPNPPMNVNVANPNAGDSGAQNPNAGDSGAQNPNAGDSGAQNPNVPISGPLDLSVVVAPQAAGPGDTVAIAGRGFTANGRGGQLFVNLVDANGNRFDTRYSEISCTQTDDFGLNLLQDLGWGCSSGSNGNIPTSGSDGTFRANIPIPAAAAPGPGQICINSIFSNPVCTPFMVGGGDGSDAQ